MNNMIEKIKTSYKQTLSFQDGLYSLKTLYFFKSQSGLREYIKDKVSLELPCLGLVGVIERINSTQWAYTLIKWHLWRIAYCLKENIYR